MNEIEKRFERFFKAGSDSRKCKTARTFHQTVIRGGCKDVMPAIPVKGIRVEAKNTARVLYPAHPNDIYSMKPADSWELYIDESGSFEDAPENQLPQGAVDNRRLVAGVMFPSAFPLKGMPELHACESQDEKQYAVEDEVISNVLQAGRNTRQCGVLVIPSRVYGGSVVNWMPNIVSFVGLVLKMMPLSGNMTKVNVHVENYLGHYVSNHDLKVVEDCCRANLMATFPERAAKIKLKVLCQKKKSDPLNGYPDVIAHACYVCYGRSEQLRQSGWRGTCYLDFDAERLSVLLECFQNRRQLPEALWNELVGRRQDGGSVISAILRAYGTEAKHDPRLWRRYLDYFICHLDSRAIQIRLLRNQVEWLAEYAPADGCLPKRAMLLWQTAKLAECNHSGGVVMDEAKEFNALVRNVMLEDAPLACKAVLHLAVAYTDAFDFKGARQVVANFIRHAVSPIARIVGLTAVDLNKRMRDLPPEADVLFCTLLGAEGYGQLLSTLGQHAAFMGEPVDAEGYFRRAIEVFKNLSAEFDRNENLTQTGSYMITTVMDNPAADEIRLRNLMHGYLGGNESLPVLIGDIAQIDVAGDKYRHHIALRYLLSGHAAEDLKTAYLAEESNWASSADGHPWELIEFYRGLLLLGTDRAARHFRNGWEIARKGGPALQVIAAVIGFALAAEGGVDRAEVERVVNRCEKELPALGVKRIAILRRQSTEPLPPLGLAKEILPFNFR